LTRATEAGTARSTGAAEPAAAEPAAARAATALASAASLIVRGRVGRRIRIRATAFEVPRSGTGGREDDDDDDRPFHKFTVLARGAPLAAQDRDVRGGQRRLLQTFEFDERPAVGQNRLQ